MHTSDNNSGHEFYLRVILGSKTLEFSSNLIPKIYNLMSRILKFCTNVTFTVDILQNVKNIIR